MTVKWLVLEFSMEDSLATLIETDIQAVDPRHEYENRTAVSTEL